MAADRGDSKNNDDAPKPSPAIIAALAQSRKLSTFGLPRLYRDVDISPDTCVLPPERLDNTPSRADGLEIETERDLRYLGCELIQSAAILLKLPQVAAASGQILYQRYFFSKSFVRNNFEHVAMACVNLASKVEEAPRRFRDVINVFHHLKQKSRLRSAGSKKRPAPLILDQSYISLKNHVIKAERRVLKELGFCVHAKHPHKLIQAYTKALEQMEHPEMMRKAWSYMNDGLRTDMFVRFKPETLACACIHLASRVCQIPLPLEPHPWWELFDADYDDITDICNMFLQLYRRPKPPSWGRLERKMNEMRTAAQEKQKSRFDNPGASGSTPNPQEGGDKFSPAQSRGVSPSPKKDYRNRNDYRDRMNGDNARGRRSRSRDMSGSPPSGHRKDLPKRYSSNHHANSPIRDRDRKRGAGGGGGKGYGNTGNGRGTSGKRRDYRDRSYSPVYQGGGNYGSRDGSKNRMPPRLADIDVPVPNSYGPGMKKSTSSSSRKHHRHQEKQEQRTREDSRSRSRSRERSSRKAIKEREREVRKALGKRRRSPSSPTDRDDVYVENDRKQFYRVVRTDRDGSKVHKKKKKRNRDRENDLPIV